VYLHAFVEFLTEDNAKSNYKCHEVLLSVKVILLRDLGRIWRLGKEMTIVETGQDGSFCLV
jgi:hypothetical protein